MPRARASFPTITANGSAHKGTGNNDRVADIMADYYTKIDRIFQADVTSTLQATEGKATEYPIETSKEYDYPDSQRQSKPADRNHGEEYSSDEKNLEVILETRLKMEQICVVISHLDDDMKKLEDDGELLVAVRKNLNDLGRNFWDWLLEKQGDEKAEAVTSNSA